MHPLTERLQQQFQHPAPAAQGTPKAPQSPAPSPRAAAAQALQSLPVPTPRHEAWKYTNLKRILERTYAPAPRTDGIDPTPYHIPGWQGDTVVFLNGRFDPGQSHIRHNAAHIHSLNGLQGHPAQAFEAHMATLVAPDTHVFTALNTAFVQEGVFIHLPAHQRLAPIHLLHLTTPAEPEAHVGIQTRVLVLAEEAAEATILESWITLPAPAAPQAPATPPPPPGHSLRIAVTEVFAAPHAQLEYLKLQCEHDHASHIERTEVAQQAHSTVRMHTITLGGEIVRNELHMHLDAEHAEAHLLGAYLLDGRQHCDNATKVHHKMPNCMSNELYKGILNDRARAAFSGVIHVYPDAQKTNAYQSNRNLLLTSTADAKARPQLEIYADDVRCSHGCAIGQLDTDALFYLRTRGLSATQARQLLLEAFLADVTDQIRQPQARAYAEARIAARFEAFGHP